MHRKHGGAIVLVLIGIVLAIMAWANSSSTAASSPSAAKNPGVAPSPPAQVPAGASEDWYANAQLWWAAQWARVMGEGVMS